MLVTRIVCIFLLSNTSIQENFGRKYRIMSTFNETSYLKLQFEAVREPMKFQEEEDAQSEEDDLDKDKDFVPATEASESEACESEVSESEVSESEASESEASECEASETKAVEDHRPSKIGRHANYCFYCETNVLNFARHVVRHHSCETDVIKILSLPANSTERKAVLADLRKKGNYIFSECSGEKKVVRQSAINSSNDYLPCKVCFGYFSKQQLWRHKKKCHSQNKAAAATLVKKTKVDIYLKRTVFPHMRSDEITLVAQKDMLICAFGTRYLRTHREKHMISVVSRKMRELSRLLIEVRKIDPLITNMMNLLNPEKYDTIVDATKMVAVYDSTNDRYESPTYAMNISKSLKDCCDIALTQILKRKKNHSTLEEANLEADIKTMIHLISTNWQFDISSQAAINLQTKKWNKVTIIPLASDLKILKDYLMNEGKLAMDNLSNSPTDKKAYVTLVEVIFAQVLLLNRKRPGELERLKIESYKEAGTHKNYEEFNDVITAAEKVLMRRFKRVVIRGKRGRGVPVLFSEIVQQQIDLVLKVRHYFFKDENLYLFGIPGHTTPMAGYKIIEKYAKKSGTKNPQAITATKLRKHLATITQLMNMGDTDVEQLASFMGHTERVHRNEYRLPDDVYQTARMCKLLLIMERGQGAAFKGKSLDEIEIDLEQNILEEPSENEDSEIEDDPVPSTSTTSEPVKSQSTTTKKTRQLVPWTAEQKEKTLHFFKNHIRKKTPPKRGECEELINKYPRVFHNKTWLKMKVYIQNQYSKK